MLYSILQKACITHSRSWCEIILQGLPSIFLNSVVYLSQSVFLELRDLALTRLRSQSIRKDMYLLSENAGSSRTLQSSTTKQKSLYSLKSKTLSVVGPTYVDSPHISHQLVGYKEGTHLDYCSLSYPIVCGGRWRPCSRQTVTSFRRLILPASDALAAVLPRRVTYSRT